MSNVKSYFETHTHHHAYHRDPLSYSEIIESVRNHAFAEEPIKILDLGCGDGSFIRGLKKYRVNGTFVGIDLSDKMVHEASKDLGNESADLLVGDGFNLPIRKDIKFNVIHIDCVLHHLIGKNRKDSTRLAQKLYGLLHDKLSDGGFIVVEEMYYVSFLVPEFTSAIVFYGLKLMNTLGINLGRVRNEFQLGLEVNFFSERRLKSMFELHSKRIHELRRSPAKVPKFYRIFLLKDLGRISYAVFR